MCQCVYSRCHSLTLLNAEVILRRRAVPAFVSDFYVFTATLMFSSESVRKWISAHITNRIFSPNQLSHKSFLAAGPPNMMDTALRRSLFALVWRPLLPEVFLHFARRASGIFAGCVASAARFLICGMLFVLRRSVFGFMGCLKFLGIHCVFSVVVLKVACCGLHVTWRQDREPRVLIRLHGSSGAGISRRSATSVQRGRTTKKRRQNEGRQHKTETKPGDTP